MDDLLKWHALSSPLSLSLGMSLNPNYATGNNTLPAPIPSTHRGRPCLFLVLTAHTALIMTLTVIHRERSCGSLTLTLTLTIRGEDMLSPCLYRDHRLNPNPNPHDQGEDMPPDMARTCIRKVEASCFP